MPASTLPLQLSSFIGRDGALGELGDFLGATRLLTLTGVGGVGKTRLALELASRFRDRFPDGVVLVSLAPIRDPALVISAVAQAIGLPQTGARPPIDGVKQRLQDQRLLLLMDNFEHVIAAAPLVADLLSSCPELRALVTSRERLRLRGEQVYLVPPLALPAASTPPGDGGGTSDLPTADAVRLFVERARAARAGFRITRENGPIVVEICRRLDGLPLAIELAAARMGLLSPPALLAHLDPRLPLLTDGPRDLPARQRTLRDTLAWSHDLLTEAERRLFRRLSAFVGGCTPEAIEAVCVVSGDDEPGVLSGIASLVDKSLIRSDEAGAEPWFSLLETVREYARERLDASGETRETLARHAAYYLRLAEHARVEQDGSGAAAWLDRLEVEHANLRAAIDWGEGEAGVEAVSGCPNGAGSGIDLATRLIDAVAWFWMMRGHLHEGRARQARLLTRTPDGTPARARALLVSSGLARYRGAYEEALELGREGLALWQRLGDRRQVAVALARLGDAHTWRGEYARARDYLERSASIFRELGGESGLEHPTMLTLAQAAWVAGDIARAELLFEQNLTTGRAAGDTHTVQVSLRYLGLLADRRGDAVVALGLHRESLRLVRELGDQACVMTGLAALAIAAAALGHAEPAARLLAAVSHVHELTGVALMPFLQEAYDERLAAVRRRLSEHVFAFAWESGAALSLEDAIEEALAIEPSPGRPPSAGAARASEERRGARHAGLTPREVEVLTLISAGRTTKQIAAELVVTVPTVERHITHIYDKIGARGRAEATVFALKHGLG